MNISLPRKTCCTPGAADAHAGSGYLSPPPPPITGLIRVNTGSTAGMIELPGGPFIMGTDRDEGFPADGEGPAREARVSPFWIDRCAVSNRDFIAFIKATGYRTEAERFGWSFVFHNQLIGRTKPNASASVAGLGWWLRVDGADWAHPEGPGSKLKHRLDFPVTHVTWNDAATYAAWAGKRLPTEAEWEYACRGGRERCIFPWGDELEPGGKHLCNIWQGDFPRHDSAADGWSGPCPVDAFPVNGYGLHNMVGNVWEWVADWWSADWHLTAERSDPHGPPGGDGKMMKGGSFLCHHTYCNRYRCAARTRNTPDSSTINCGFRCVRDL